MKNFDEVVNEWEASELERVRARANIVWADEELRRSYDIACGVADGLDDVEVELGVYYGRVRVNVTADHVKTVVPIIKALRSAGLPLKSCPEPADNPPSWTMGDYNLYITYYPTDNASCVLEVVGEKMHSYTTPIYKMICHGDGEAISPADLNLGEEVEE